MFVSPRNIVRMKFNIFSTWWTQLQSLLQAPDVEVSDDIQIPTVEQQTRARSAFERLRREARNMTPPFTVDEILDMVKSGRR